MFVLKDDSWISEILGYSCFRVVVDEQSANTQESIPVSSSRSFYFTKVNVDDLGAISEVLNQGFALVDTYIVFEKDIDPQKVNETRYSRLARPEDESAVTALAHDNFIYSRFHLDPQIADQSANAVKREWVRNYFKGQRGDDMVIGETEDGIGGFIQLLYPNTDLANIDLIAVGKNFQRKGMARDMIAHVEKICTDKKSVQVGTQLVNKPSIRLYESMGFRYKYAQYVFHRHDGAV